MVPYRTNFVQVKSRPIDQKICNLAGVFKYHLHIISEPQIHSNTRKELLKKKFDTSMKVNIQKGHHSSSTENALFIYSWFRGGHEIETFGTVHLTKRQTFFFKQHLINPIKIDGLKFLGSSPISYWGSQFEVLQVSCTFGGLNQTLSQN